LSSKRHIGRSRASGISRVILNFLNGWHGSASVTQMAPLHLKRCMLDLKKLERKSKRRRRRAFCRLAVLSSLTRPSSRGMNGFHNRVTGLNRIFVTQYTTWMSEKERAFGRNVSRAFALIADYVSLNLMLSINRIV